MHCLKWLRHSVEKGLQSRGVDTCCGLRYRDAFHDERFSPTAVEFELECLRILRLLLRIMIAARCIRMLRVSLALRILGKRRLPIRPPLNFELPTT